MLNLNIILMKKKKKILIFKESFKMKNIDDKFEEQNYEKIIKKNFAKINQLKRKLIFEII